MQIQLLDFFSKYSNISKLNLYIRGRLTVVFCPTRLQSTEYTISDQTCCRICVFHLVDTVALSRSQLCKIPDPEPTEVALYLLYC